MLFKIIFLTIYIENIKPESKYFSKTESFEQCIAEILVWEKRCTKEKKSYFKNEMKRKTSKIMDNIKKLVKEERKGEKEIKYTRYIKNGA